MTPAGDDIRMEPTDRASWQIHPEGNREVHLTYLYRADQPDAGGCYVDGQLIYVNPIHCCLYTREHRDQPLTAQLITPDGWKIACGLPGTGNTFSATNYDEWVDMPLLASPHLIHHAFEHKNLKLNLWMHTLSKPQLDRFEADVCRIVDTQTEMMGPLPVESYHFMLLALPYSRYHGVEHRNSTMMVLGPDAEIFRSLYPELLGLSAHEFFHTWNVKYIKPDDLMRYDYQRENYSPLGYVFEGFTTYYGDLSLLRSGIFSWNEYAHEVDVYLNRHLMSYARENASLRDSGFNTWVDGYGGDTAAPHRSVSIYAEGMLCALCLDLNIRRVSQNRQSLDDLMRHLRERADQGMGYDETDLIEFLNSTSGHCFKELFEQLYHKPVTLTEPLNKALDWIGCTLQHVESEDAYAHSIGLRLQGGAGAQLVIGVAPGSAADRSGIRVGDQVTEIVARQNVYEVKWTNRMFNNQVSLLQIDACSWFGSSRLIRLPITHQQQEENYLHWSSSKRA
jgi:predicted metalloprotease with PDZ domain